MLAHWGGCDCWLIALAITEPIESKSGLIVLLDSAFLNAALYTQDAFFDLCFTVLFYLDECFINFFFNRVDLCRRMRGVLQASNYNLVWTLITWELRWFWHLYWLQVNDHIWFALVRRNALHRIQWSLCCYRDSATRSLLFYLWYAWAGVCASNAQIWVLWERTFISLTAFNDIVQVLVLLIKLLESMDSFADLCQAILPLKLDICMPWGHKLMKQVIFDH